MKKALLFCALLLTSCGGEKQSEPKLNVVLEQQVQDESVDAAMVHLAREMERSSEVSAFCHGLTHSIGHAAYDRYGIEALRENNDLCGSGYFHGVIEKHFESDAAVLEKFQEICDENDARCFHGLGHGLMFATENDLPRSIELCRELTRTQSIQCSEGVYMENFGVDGEVHTTLYRSDRDPLYPCNEQESPYDSVCIFYAIRQYLATNEDDIVGATALCRSVDPIIEDACFKGVGSGLTKNHIADLTSVQTACDTLDPTMRSFCYEGIASYIIVHYASPQKGQEWCDTLRNDMVDTCEKIVEESIPFYEFTDE